MPNQTKPDHFFWMATDNGQIIDLLKPDPESFTIEDIAAQLSKLCRFNGAIKQFYSVAEHCVHVSAMCPPEYKKIAILHDAPEAFICDVPTPLKRLLGSAYTDIEDRIAAAIGEKFEVDIVNLPDVVKQADRALVVTERDQLQTNPISWGPDYENSIRYPDKVGRWTDSNEAQEGYLDAWYKLPGNANPIPTITEMRAQQRKLWEEKYHERRRRGLGTWDEVHQMWVR